MTFLPPNQQHQSTEGENECMNVISMILAILLYQFNRCLVEFWDAVASICTSLQTDNNTNTSSLNFYTPDALPDAQPTASKH